MKRIIIITVLLVGVVFTFFSFRTREEEEKNYENFLIKKGDIRTTITATGAIEPITQVEVGTQVSGTISRIYVDYNSEVKKGQLIAELERTVLESEYNSQQATYESCRNEFGYQEKNYNRVLGLHAKKLMSDSDFETAQYQYEKARQALDKSCSDLRKAETNLNYCMIYSPIDGVVLSRAVDEGQTVAAMFNTPKLFLIANDLQKMQVIADIDEADIGQVALGQKVVFFVDAFPDDQFEGSVTQVRLEPKITSNVVTYEVVIDAPNPDLKLKPGLTANITVLTSERKGVLIMPLRALRFQPEEEVKQLHAGEAPASIIEKESKTVWTQTGNGLKCKPVRTGVSDGIYVEVLDGISAGENVITGIHVRRDEAKEPVKKKGGNPLMPNMTGDRPH